MRSLSIVFALAIIGASIAAPRAPDAVVPETSLLQTAAEADAEAFQKAKTAVDTLLASGKDESACADLADSILDEVRSVVTQKEELLATMEDGSKCPSKGQGVVDAAQDHLTEAQKTKSSADSAAATAASAPVDFGVYPLSSLADLAEGKCGTFENDAAYVAAKNAAETAASAAATAAADVTAAETALEDAKTAQQAAIKKCQCDTHTSFEAAYKEANTRSDADLTAWKKGQHMKCVLAGTDPSACDVGSAPEVTKRALAEGVDASSCLTPKQPKKCASGQQIPSKPLADPAKRKWYLAEKINMSCNEVCGECGLTFDASAMSHFKGLDTCTQFFPGAENWGHLNSGTPPIACPMHGWEPGRDDRMKCHELIGGVADGDFKHESCRSICVCRNDNM
jgi:sRNA-binding protein